jgi:hypothetical protein
MTVQMPRRRDQRLGKNISKIPNRTDVQRIGPASDPGARGGPTNVPLGAFGGGEGLESAGKAITASGISQLEEIQKEQKAQAKLEAKLLNDIQKNKILKAEDNYQAELGALNKTFDWSREYKDKEGNERQPIDVFTEFHTAIKEKYAPHKEDGTGIADSFTPENALDYDAKHYAAGLTAAITASDKQREVTNTLIKTRLVDKFGKYYLSKGGGVGTPDPTINGHIPLLIEMAKQNQGSLTDMAVDDETTKYIVGWYQRRVEFLSQPLKSGVADTYQAINDLTERMKQQYPDALTAPVMKETMKALSTISERRYQSSQKVQEHRAKEESDKRVRESFTKEQEEIDKLYPNRDTSESERMQHHSKSNLLRQQYGYKTEGLFKATPEETVFDSFGNVIRQGTPDPSKQQKPTVVPKGAAVLRMNPDGTTKTDKDGNVQISVVNKGVEEVENPNWIAKDGVSLTIGATTELRLLIGNMFGVPSGSEGEYRANTQENTALIQKFKETVVENLLKRDEKGKYTTQSLDDAISMALDEIEELPKSFNFADMANQLAKVSEDGSVIVNNKGTYARGSSTYKWEGVEKTSNKLRAETTEFYNEIKSNHEKGVYKGISLDDATGMQSTIINAIGSLLGSFMKGAVSEDVTVARFQYGLLVRDFVRKFTLSPRFAVKEQELLRAMFPGPGMWNVPGQAAARMREFDAELDNSIKNNLMITSADGISSKDKLEAIKDLRYVVGMKNRLAKFDLSGRASASEKSPIQIGKLTDSQLQQFADDPESANRFLMQHEKTKALRAGNSSPKPVEKKIEEKKIEETKPDETIKNTGDPNANLRETIQNINPDDVVSYANKFIQDNADDPAGAFINVIKQIGESEKGDSILNEIRSLLDSKPKKKKTSVKKKKKTSVKKKKKFDGPSYLNPDLPKVSLPSISGKN